MLIGISGKIGSGKDTVGKIINYLITGGKEQYESIEGFLEYYDDAKNEDGTWMYPYEIKKFADTLKDTVCLWTGCTREQLEDADFKDSKIGPEWVRYAYAIGHGTRNGETIMWSMTCTEEEYEEQKRINWQTAYKQPLTYRMLLQMLGTECMRNTIHINGWVNALFGKYKPTGYTDKDFPACWIHPNEIYNYNKENCIAVYPNWIVTDMRFPNELKAVKDRGDITIRVNRNNGTRAIDINPHESETALDNAEFDYTIDNNGTIEELIEKVKKILIKEKVI